MDRTQIRWIAFRVLALYLAAIAVYRVVIPASGLPEPSTTYKMIWLDLGIVAVFLLGRALLGNLPDDDDRRAKLPVFFWIGLAGAAVILGIRFFGNDNSFWSGHLGYRLRY